MVAFLEESRFNFIGLIQPYSVLFSRKFIYEPRACGVCLEFHNGLGTTNTNGLDWGLKSLFIQLKYFHYI